MSTPKVIMYLYGGSYLFLLIFGTAFTLKMCTDWSKLPNIYQDSNLSVSFWRFKNVSSKSMMNCVMRCLNWNLCKSVDYVSATSRCFLNQDSKEDLGDGMFYPQNGTLHTNISDWSRTFTGACNHHVCDDNSYCEVQRDWSQTCVPF